jgi:cephalosporin-C deacetylase-like acetyl esterase
LLAAPAPPPEAALDAAVAKIKTPADVRRWQRAVRARIEEILGPLPRRTPLRPRVTGRIEMPYFTIEKVIFESQPRYYVTANLYIPKGRPLPAPGILIPCGHDPLGKAYKEYHKAGMGFARKGYVALVFDPTGQGERSECIDARTGRDLVRMCVCQHHWTGKPCFLTGMTLAGYRLWDGIRCIDYLVTRREVDASRIGVMGNSGGGSMTLLITAVDERVKACVAAHPGGSCEDTHLRGQRPPDRSIWSLIAPRPCRISLGRDSHEEPHHQRKIDIMKPFYRACGHPERLDLVVVTGFHDLKRPKRVVAYEWFNRWFGKAGETAVEAPLRAMAPDELFCTKTGQVQLSLGGETMFSMNRARAARISAKRTMPRTRAAFDLWRIRMLAAVQERLCFQRAPVPLDTKILGRSRADGIVIERLVFESEPGMPVPALLFRPKGDERPGQTVVHVSDVGKPQSLRPAPLPLLLARRGMTVLSIDARDTGETSIGPAGDAQWRGYERHLWRHERLAIRALAIGRTLSGMRTLDVIRAVDMAEERGLAGDRGVVVVGEGKGAIWAMQAAAFDTRIAAVAAVRFLASWRMLTDNRYYNQFEHFWVPGVLFDFDVPDLPALVAPRRVALIGAVDEMTRAIAPSRMRGLFTVARGAFALCRRRGNLVFAESGGAQSVARTISSLLRRDELNRRRDLAAGDAGNGATGVV